MVGGGLRDLTGFTPLKSIPVRGKSALHGCLKVIKDIP